MPKPVRPRYGSMQVWPRKRARRQYAKVKAYPSVKDAKILGFAGYKVGMTHLIAEDNRPNSLTKKETISIPVSIVECPPLKTASIVLYKKTHYGPKTSKAIMHNKLDKELARKIKLPKAVKTKIEDIKPEEYDDLRLVVYTQPKLTDIGKKKPEIFEIAVGGNNITDKFNYAKKVLGEEIKLQDAFSEGNHVDIHVVTKGRGFQGPVKRFGIGLKSHKAEKGRRAPGSLGGWCGQGHVMYRVAHAGQMGYHQRVDYNKWILKISDDPKEINKNGGYHRYGNVKNTFMLIKGSVGGPQKRMIRLTQPIRPNKKIPNKAPAIEYINK